MKSSFARFVIVLSLVAMGLAIAAAGIYIGETDDAPGAALLGIVVAIGMLALSVRTALRKPQHP